jgi:hypothetical protein
LGGMCVRPDDLSREGTATWLATQKAYRAKTLSAMGYNGSIYNVSELEWTQTSYIQPQMHP